MATYVARGLSFQTQNPDIVAKILACPTIERILFPAYMPMFGGQDVKLLSSQRFDLSMIPDEFGSELFTRVPLRGENGLEFSATIYLEKSVTPNVFYLIFTSTHIQEDIISYATLRTLLDEVLPVFKCNHFSVYPEVKRKGYRTYFYIPNSTNYYPIQLGWMTYFGEEVAKFLTPQHFDAVTTYSKEIVSSQGDVLLTLQEKPFDPDDPSHWEKEAKAIADLGLEQFSRKQ